MEWAVDHFLASKSDECPMCGKKAIELSEKARIAELEQALRGILHEWDAKSITGRRFTEAIEAARKVLKEKGEYSNGPRG